MAAAISPAAAPVAYREDVVLATPGGRAIPSGPGAAEGPVITYKTE